MTETLSPQAFRADFDQLGTPTDTPRLTMRLAFTPAGDELSWTAEGTATVCYGTARPFRPQGFPVTGMLSLSPEPEVPPTYVLRVHHAPSGLSVELSASSAVPPSGLDTLTFRGEYLWLAVEPVVIAEIEVAMTAESELDAASSVRHSRHLRTDQRTRSCSTMDSLRSGPTPITEMRAPIIDSMAST